MMNREEAKAELLRWHRWSVVLRAESYKHTDAATVLTLLHRVLDGSNDVPEYGSTLGPWMDGPDYDRHAVDALVEGFVELYETLARSDLANPKRLGDLFDAVEFLPFELMREGPSKVEKYLNSYSELFHELVPMVLIFRHHLRRRDG